MHKNVYIILSSAVALMLCDNILAQNVTAGLYASMRGFGITAEISNPKSMDIFTLYADSYGVVTGRCKDFGISAQYSHDYILKKIQFEFETVSIHGGAGGMIGYVHDYEKGFFSEYDRTLTKGFGLAAALACNLGIRFDFLRKVTLDFNLTALPGLHLRADSATDSYYVSFYKNGLILSPFAQMSIMYRF